MLREIWAIQHAAGHLLCPALDDDGTDSFLAWPTREQAEKGLAFQIRQGYIDEGDGEVVCVARCPDPDPV